MRPCVVGILNVTADSFYDGGRYKDHQSVVDHAKWLVQEGADIIDIGVVSSRIGAQLLPPDVEACRLAEAVRIVHEALPDAILSADTCYAQPAVAAVKAGAHIINDISGGQFDQRMFAAIADMQVPYVLNHTRGLPSEMNQLTQYDNLMRDIAYYFTQRLDDLYQKGVSDVIIDPGFGFAKTTPQNFEIVNHLDHLRQLFHEPIMVGVSRKRMIYQTLEISANQALNGTTVINTLALERGASMLRVHDPRPAREAIKLVMQTMYS